MIHYSCDRCKRLIETEDELRYVVRFVVQASFGDEDNEIHPGATDHLPGPAHHLFEMDELVDSVQGDLPRAEDSVCSRQRFDLCSECYAAFQSDPLGRETTKPVGFSNN